MRGQGLEVFWRLECEAAECCRNGNWVQCLQLLQAGAVAADAGSAFDAADSASALPQADVFIVQLFPSVCAGDGCCFDYYCYCNGC